MFLFYFAFTLLCLPCCALIFFSLSGCALIFLRTYSYPAVPLSRFSLTIDPAVALSFCAYPAVPFSLFSLNNYPAEPALILFSLTLLCPFPAFRLTLTRLSPHLFYFRLSYPAVPTHFFFRLGYPAVPFSRFSLRYLLPCRARSYFFSLTLLCRYLFYFRYLHRIDDSNSTNIGGHMRSSTRWSLATPYVRSFRDGAFYQIQCATS